MMSAQRTPDAVNSEKGLELDRRLRDYCAAHTALETAVNAAQIGCARVFNLRDQYQDEHYAAREMTVPVLDRQSGVPIRVFGVVAERADIDPTAGAGGQP
jgi:crotonobetainyl-CoA:carnitine CoA-transferase CaiB-like acyl-CoA transferase